jgi:hypothetical protein
VVHVVARVPVTVVVTEALEYMLICRAACEAVDRSHVMVCCWVVPGLGAGMSAMRPPEREGLGGRFDRRVVASGATTALVTLVVLEDRMNARTATTRLVPVVVTPAAADTLVMVPPVTVPVVPSASAPHHPPATHALLPLAGAVGYATVMVALSPDW